MPCVPLQPPPTTTDGPPNTLPGRAICAALKLVQASYLCYDAPVFDCDVAPHFGAYLETLDSAAEAGAYSQLAGNLLAFVHLIHDSQLDMPDSEQLQVGLQSYHQLFGTPPAVQAAVSRQLEQLSAEQPGGQPPFTTHQLQVAWLGLIVRNAGVMLHAHDHVMQGQLPPAEQPAVDAAAAAMQFAAHTWLQLEPNCDRAVEAKAFAAPISRLTTVWPRSQPQDVSLVLEAYSRAQAQHRLYAAARCAVFATNLALLVPLEPDTLRAVMAAFETAEPSLRA